MVACDACLECFSLILPVDLCNVDLRSSNIVIFCFWQLCIQILQVIDCHLGCAYKKLHMIFMALNSLLTPICWQNCLKTNECLACFSVLELMHAEFKSAIF